MKKIILIMAFVLMINSFLIADEKDVNIADSRQQNSNIENAKFFEAIFGLLPNPDGEINNLAFVKLNYTANLSSSILYYSREYAKVESRTTEDGDDVQNLNSMKRRDVKLNVINYKFHLIDKSDGTGIILSPEFNVNYYDEEKIKELNSTWDSDINPGTRDLYFERMRYNSRSLMPIIEASVEFSFGKNFSINIGGGFLPVSFDRNHFDEFGASTEADPELQREAYYEAKYNVNFTSMGYTVKCNMQIEKLFWGSLFVDFYYLYKFGDSEVSDRWWDADLQKNIIEKYSVVDKRTIINADVFYQMDFLEFRGIIPILKFGYLNQKVTLDDEKEPVLSYDEYDFGVAVKI